MIIRVLEAKTVILVHTKQAHKRQVQATKSIVQNQKAGKAVKIYDSTDTLNSIK